MSQITESIKTAFFTVLFIFICFFLFTKLFGPIPFQVNSIQTTKTDLFTVSGEGEAKGKPEKAHVSVGVTKIAKTADQAQNLMNETTNSIVNELKKAGVPQEAIKTSSYNVYPNYDNIGRPVPFSSDTSMPEIVPNGDDQRITSYTATQNLDITAETVELANKAVDVATANGANIISGVSFVLSDEDREELEQKARIEAINKAKAKAKKIADAADIRLGKIVNIQESGNNYPVYMEAQKSLDRGAPTELQPGENTVRIGVTLSYETL